MEPLEIVTGHPEVIAALDCGWAEAEGIVRGEENLGIRTGAGVTLSFVPDQDIGGARRLWKMFMRDDEVDLNDHSNGQGRLS